MFLKVEDILEVFLPICACLRALFVTLIFERLVEDLIHLPLLERLVPNVDAEV